MFPDEGMMFFLGRRAAGCCLPEFWAGVILRKSMVSAEVSGAEWTSEREVNVFLAVLALQDSLSFSGSVDATMEIHCRNLKTCSTRLRGPRVLDVLSFNSCRNALSVEWRLNA